MVMINEKMKQLGNVRSAIRDLFEYGIQRKAVVGAENVFDYSLGNPSVPAPSCVSEEIGRLNREEDPVSLHGYSVAAGISGVRESIAADLNQRFNAGITAGCLYMTCGAAASLTITLKALSCEGDEFIAVAPFFPEYRVFVEMTGSTLRVLPADIPDFQINFEELEKILNPHTKGIIINSPNNPTGVVLKEETISRLTTVLREKSEEYGHPVYLIADEPYRELVYDDINVPYLPNYYDNTIVCYSFSKSLSLPGERIGYILVSPKCEGFRDLYAAVAGAGRALGFVCAPVLMQRVIAKCLGRTSDIEVYRKNRDILYNALTSYGYECVYPDGAFYLFVKAPEADAVAFSERAKKYELLLVPSDSFGTPGYVRLSYCIPTDTIERSLPAFEALIREYR